jgi:hypothetical protein
MERALWYSLLSDHLKEAEQISENKILKSSSGGPVAIKRAHAYLLNGRYGEARDLYQTWKDKPMTSDSAKTYADDIRDNFDKFCKLGIAGSDVDKISQEIGL